MSKSRYGRNNGSRRAYLKQYASGVTKPTGKSISHSARMTRKVLRESPESLAEIQPRTMIGTTDWGYVDTKDTPFHKGCDECHCHVYRPLLPLKVNEKGRYPRCKCGHDLRDHNKAARSYDPREDAQRKSKIVAMGGNLYMEWAGDRFQSADMFQKLKLIDLPYRETIWMFFSGNRVFFVKQDHSLRKAWMSNNWYTTKRATEALGQNLVSWQEEVDYAGIT